MGVGRFACRRGARPAGVGRRPPFARRSPFGGSELARGRRWRNMRPMTRASRSWRPDSEAARTGTARGGRRRELSEPSVRVAKRPSWSHRTVVRRGRRLACHSTGDDDMVGVVDGKRLRAASVSGLRHRAQRASGESVIPGARWMVEDFAIICPAGPARCRLGRHRIRLLSIGVAALLLHGSFRSVPRRLPLRFAYPAPPTGDRGFALPSCRSCSGAQEKGGGAVRAPPPDVELLRVSLAWERDPVLRTATPCLRRTRRPSSRPCRTPSRTFRSRPSEHRRRPPRGGCRTTRQRRPHPCRRSSRPYRC